MRTRDAFAIAASFLLILALALLATRAAAEEDAPAEPAAPRPWAVSARSAYTYLGPRERPTGGMTITADLSRSWPLGERFDVAVGAELAAFGFEVGGRWLAVLGGPVTEIRWHAATVVAIGVAAHLDAGRVPTCTRWGFPMLYSGFFPAGTISLRYEPSASITLAATGGARAIRTLAWSGAGMELGVSGTYRFGRVN